MNKQEYDKTSEALVERIERLVPSHPEILEMRNPFDLFSIAEFDCADLAPSLYQGSEALKEVKRRHSEKKEGTAQA
jgi:hypothetical protein